MKTILRMFMVAGLVAAMIAPAMAQDGQGGPPPPGTRGGGGQRGGEGGGMQNLTPEQRRQLQQKREEAHRKTLTEIGLSQDQLSRVRAAEQKRDQALAALRQQAGQGGGDRQAMGQKMREIQQTFQREFREILGQEKFAQYNQKMRAAMEKIYREMGIEPPPERGGPGGPGGRGGQGGPPPPPPSA